MIQIDQETCIGCGACVKDCPGSALSLAEGKAEVKRDCIHCGHCVAICPVAAVSIPEYAMDEVETYDKESFTVCPEQFLHAVKFRRSIRNYTDKPIEKEKFRRILDAGRYTPTAKNRQACRFVVIQDQLEEFKKLVWEEMPKVLEVLKKKAPEYAAAFTYFYRKYQKNPKDDTFFFNTTSFLVIASENPLDAGLAAANIENMAVAEGAGALYSGYMIAVIEASPVLKEWLGVPDIPVRCCMLMGYPAVHYKRTAPRKESQIDWR